MRDKDLKSLGASQTELKRSRPRESREAIRKRLTVDADPSALRALAAKEMDRRVRKRLLALACVAEGMSPLAAAITTQLDHGAALASVRRFQQEGVAGLQDRKINGRPYRLRSEHFEELRLEILQRPRMGYEELKDFVWTRFRVRYSRASLARLLKKELKVVWHAGMFWTADAWAERRTRLGQKSSATEVDAENPKGRPRKLSGSQLQEIRDAVLKRPETSFVQLNDLIWCRFRVRYSHASLKRLLMDEFGIAWTGSRKKLSEGLDLAELQATAANATTDWRLKEKLKVLIAIAKGGEPKTVAHSNGVHLETLREWARRYRRFGVEGLRGKPREHDGRPPKLSLQQRGILTKKMRAQPEMEAGGLCLWVKARFGVTYSPAHMRRLARAVTGSV